MPDLAARLEHRLYGSGTTDAMLQDGCERAVAAGLAAVICRPEHVSLAAQFVAGSPVDVVSPFGFGLPATAASSTAALVAQASALVGDGASEVAMVACRAQS